MAGALAALGVSPCTFTIGGGPDGIGAGQVAAHHGWEHSLLVPGGGAAPAWERGVAACRWTDGLETVWNSPRRGAGGGGAERWSLGSRVRVGGRDRSWLLLGRPTVGAGAVTDRRYTGREVVAALIGLPRDDKARGEAFDRLLSATPAITLPTPPRPSRLRRLRSRLRRRSPDPATVLAEAHLRGGGYVHDLLGPEVVDRLLAPDPDRGCRRMTWNALTVEALAATL